MIATCQMLYNFFLSSAWIGSLASSQLTSPAEELLEGVRSTPGEHKVAEIWAKA